MSQHFFMKLLPNRPTFAQDMTAEERELMQRHGASCGNLMAEGKLLVFGPVMDPAGAFGVGILRAEDQAQAEAWMKDDPAATINRYEIYPMHAVFPAEPA